MMRLLKRLPGGGFELISVNNDDPPPYAILSHTWTEGQEVTYNELVAGTGRGKTGYAKIHFCGERATADSLEYFWVDTCCIDKSTSNELSMAINSMFCWYQRASKCYVYLSDVRVPAEVADAQAFQITWAEAFRRSRWFKRGWTLQELLAPPMVEFFSEEGKRLGSKISLEQEIHDITKIPIGVLRGQSFSKFSIEERMSWAANRTTTLKEDKVYCLLGIFEVFLPLIYGEGEAYATVRLREEIQRRQEGRGTESRLNLTVSLSLPFPRNELFIGREAELQSLELFLLPNAHRRITIYGLGGCGKSALALEYAYRALTRHARYLVFWVPAISQESFELAYREIGIRLQIPGITDDNADIKQLVKDALSLDSTGQWLMIVDNADDPGVLMGGAGGNLGSTRLYDYLPYSNRGKVVFTTRSRKAAGGLSPSSVLELNDMSEDEAQQLLLRRISKQALLHDKNAVNKLLEILTYLPLAIVQAAAFMNNNDISVSEYVSLFRKAGTKAELFGEHFEDPSRYQEMDSTIAKTWHISFDQIQRQNPLAAEYLSFMACIDRINIPQSLLPLGGSLVQQAKAVGTLKGYAFITERQQALQELESEKFFDMHRLVHMALEWWLDGHNEQTAWIAKAATRLKKLIPYGGHERKEAWTTYLPHAIHVAKLDGKLEEIARVSLLTRIGRCQASLGQYSAAETTHRQVFSLREKSLGKEHDRTLISMNDLGVALFDQGKYKEAEELEVQVVETKKRVLGVEHSSTLTIMNNLALTYMNQGQWKEAEELQMQVMETTKMVLGVEHPDTLTSINNLAVMYMNQGQWKEAEELEVQVMETRKRVLGVEHSSTLTSMSNLASTYRNQRQWKEAKELEVQVMETTKMVLGVEHPDTLTSINNLAVTYMNQGQWKEAEELQMQVIETTKRVLGAEHPDTLTSMSNLASTYRNQRQWKEAKELQVQVMEMRKRVLGAEHPDTLTSMNNLAWTWKDLKQDTKALDLLTLCLDLTVEKLGTNHPKTLAYTQTYNTWKIE